MNMEKRIGKLDKDHVSGCIVVHVKFFFDELSAKIAKQVRPLFGFIRL